MKKLLFILIVLVGGYWGATHQSQLKDYWDHINAQYFGGKTAETSNEPVIEEELPAPVVVAPEPEPEPEPEPTPSGPPPLGEGVYYTRERITQVTDAGVSVINARVMVKKVGEEQGRLLVDDGKQRVLTSLSRLTNDPVEVATMLQESLPATPAKDAPGSSKGTGTSKRVDPSVRAANLAKYRQYTVQIEELNRAIGSLMKQVSMMETEAAGAKSRGRPSTYNDRNIVILNQRIAALEAQRAKVRMEQATIPR